MANLTFQEDGALEDNVLSVLLRATRDLTENWEIDLSKHLQGYLDFIEENSLNAQEILSAINFTKAALLVQKSADIYGKKVDYLWQILHNALDARSTRGDGENSKTGAATKRTREGKDNHQISLEFRSLDEEFCASVGDINLKSRDTPIKLKCLPVYNPQLDAFLGGKKIELYGRRGNAVGNKYDFRVNKYVSSAGMLISEPELGNSEYWESVQPAFEQGENDCHDAEEICNFAGAPPAEDEEICDIADVPPVEEEVITDNVLDRTSENSVKTVRKEAAETVNNDPWEKVATKSEKVKELQPRPTVHIPQEAEFVSMAMQKKRPVDSPVVERNKKPPSLLAFFANDIVSKGKKKACYLAFSEYCVPSEKKVEEEEPDLETFIRDLASEFGEDFCGFEDSVLIDSDVEDNYDLNECDEVAPMECLPQPVDIPAPGFCEFIKEVVVVPAKPVDIEDNIAEVVNEWHDSIRHILKASQERGHFDIHKYCALVLSRFPHTEKHPVLCFSKIVGVREQVENVSRYFLATLMLANANNVEIIRTAPDDPLAMDCMNVKLLSRVRNNELLEEMYG